VTIDAQRQGQELDTVPLQNPQCNQQDSDLEVISVHTEPNYHKSEPITGNRNGLIPPVVQESENSTISRAKDLKPSTSNNSGWIKPKASQQKSAKKYFSVIPGTSGTSTAKKLNSPWALEVTRTLPAQRDAQKRLKQSTLFDVSKPLPPKTVDLSTLSGYGGGERKIKFGLATTPPAAPQVTSTKQLPVQPLVTRHKRKSDELNEGEDDEFGSDDDDLFGDCYMPGGDDEAIQVQTPNKENEDETSNATNWADDSIFVDPAIDLMEQNESGGQNLERHIPPSPLKEVTPQKQKGVLSLRGKKKEEEARRRGQQFRTTQEIIRDFDRYV